VEAAQPGTRCAVNLSGVGLESLSRGLVLTAPDALAPTTAIDAPVKCLAEARPVQEPTPVTLLAGTAERLARIAPIGEPVLAPGTSGFARLHLSAPIALLPGDHFVLRGVRSRAPRAARRSAAGPCSTCRLRTAGAATRISCATSRRSRCATPRPTCACACAARGSRAPRAPRSRATRGAWRTREAPGSRGRRG